MLDINWIKNNHFKQKNFKEYWIHAESETQLFFFLLFSFSLIVAQELLQDFFTLIYFQVFAFTFDRGSFLHGDRFNQEIRSRCEFRAPRAERFTSVPVVSSPAITDITVTGILVVSRSWKTYVCTLCLRVRIPFRDL